MRFEDVDETSSNLTQSVAIENHTACAITYRIRRVAGSVRTFRSQCNQHGPASSIHEGKSAWCTIEFAPPRPGHYTQILEVTYGYANHCLLQEITDYDFQLHAQRREKEAEELRLRVQGPDYSAADEATATERERFETRKKELEDRLLALQRENPEVRKIHEEAAQRREAFAASLTERQEALDRYRERGPDLAALAEREDKLKADLQEEIAGYYADAKTTCDKTASLRREKAAAIAELESGNYCNRCNRPASQIRREEGVSLEAHVRKVRGEIIPAPQHVVDEARQRYDSLIARAVSECEAARNNVQSREAAARQKFDRNRHELEERRRAMTERYEKRIELLESALTRERTLAAQAQTQFDERIRRSNEAHTAKIQRTTEEIAENRNAHQLALRRIDEERARARAAHAGELQRLNDEAAKIRREINDFQIWVEQKRRESRQFRIELDGNYVRVQN